jgi:hypothetical protein
MISYFPGQDGSVALIAPISDGFSDAARSIDLAIEKELRHYAGPRMEALVAEIDQIMVEAARDTGEGFASVDLETASAAMQFAYSLPWSVPTPEVAPDPDGDISFDWLGLCGKMFSVSVSKTGRIAYAGRFGDKSKIHGIDQLSTSCPQEIIRGITRAIT